eukprot:TRINITY_DN12334_c0_g1_i1.p1 TRINITY_DN12334_c0_g1~~TRINITY_DN12334_c0_g1_i1.p1  ORF type:complete len:525 (+),score=171.11 TRINITY_DN12334_c0_g1_i1:3-1577(+)
MMYRAMQRSMPRVVHMIASTWGAVSSARSSEGRGAESAGLMLQACEMMVHVDPIQRAETAMQCVRDTWGSWDAQDTYSLRSLLSAMVHGPGRELGSGAATHASGRGSRQLSSVGVPLAFIRVLLHSPSPEHQNLALALLPIIRSFHIRAVPQQLIGSACELMLQRGMMSDALALLSNHVADRMTSHRHFPGLLVHDFIAQLARSGKVSVAVGVAKKHERRFREWAAETQIDRYLDFPCKRSPYDAVMCGIASGSNSLEQLREVMPRPDARELSLRGIEASWCVLGTNGCAQEAENEFESLLERATAPPRSCGQRMALMCAMLRMYRESGDAKSFDRLFERMWETFEMHYGAPNTSLGRRELKLSDGTESFLEALKLWMEVRGRAEHFEVMEEMASLFHQSTQPAVMNMYLRGVCLSGNARDVLSAVQFLVAHQCEISPDTYEHVIAYFMKNYPKDPKFVKTLLQECKARTGREVSLSTVQMLYKGGWGNVVAQMLQENVDDLRNVTRIGRAPPQGAVAVEYSYD